MVRLENVSKQYGTPQEPVRALQEVSFTVAEHDFAAITGPSGCGKSTLLHLLGGLDLPSAGEVWVGNLPLHEAGEADLTQYRREKLGIVFQFFNLLPTMTVQENVALPLLLQGVAGNRANVEADRLIDLVGLGHRRGHFTHQLSGGEMQRTAIARALVHKPGLLLADEPTGNLDSRSAAQVLEVLCTIAAQKLTTLIVVTHSEDVAQAAGTRLHMLDGRLVEQTMRGAAPVTAAP